MMLGTYFLDGPAAGVTLLLARAPQFLRAVHSARGGWDALDDVADRPKRTERITVYRRLGPVSFAFVDYCTPGGRRRGSRVAEARYGLVRPQPPESQVRDNNAWRQWCRDQSSPEEARPCNRT